MTNEISFKRWCIRQVWSELKDLWFLWLLLFCIASIITLSGCFLPDFLKVNSFMNKGLFGLVVVWTVFGIIYLFYRFVVEPIRNYKKDLYERYEEDTRGKKTGDP